MLRGGVAPHGSVGLSLLLLLWKVDDERGLGFEADGDRVAGGSPQRTRFQVLDVDGQPPGGGVDDVLGGNADVRRLEDGPRERVHLAVADSDLLWTAPDCNPP